MSDAPKPVEALSYEPMREPVPRRRVGLVMAVGFVVLLLSVFPCGFMMAAEEHYPSNQNVAMFMAVIATMMVISGLFLIISAAREMLRR